MDLEQYLGRIGLQGPLPATLATLQAVHRAQAFAIPYEGLDVQQGVTLDLDPARIFTKLVTNKRGGWCYETNGLLHWALTELGFEVRRCTAGVHRKDRGDTILGNHLTLIAKINGQNWLCDLGLGDGLRAPIPLTEGVHHDGALQFRLERLPEGYWRFHNHSFGAPPNFDFKEDAADEALFQHFNHFLQTDPASYFLLNAEVMLMLPDQSLTLLGRVLRHATAQGVTKQMIDSPDALAAILAERFGITGVDVAVIWPKIMARHVALFGDITTPP